jgi:hypothetical protein
MAGMRSITTTMDMLHTSSFVSDHPSPLCVVFVVVVAFPFPQYWKPPVTRSITTTIATLHVQNSK